MAGIHPLISPQRVASKEVNFLFLRLVTRPPWAICSLLPYGAPLVIKMSTIFEPPILPLRYPLVTPCYRSPFLMDVIKDVLVFPPSFLSPLSPAWSRGRRVLREDLFFLLLHFPHFYVKRSHALPVRYSL